MPDEQLPKILQQRADTRRELREDVYLEETWLRIALAATRAKIPSYAGTIPSVRAEAAANYADVLLERFEDMRRKLRHRKGEI